MNDAPPTALGLAVALGAGLLIGLERERRKGQGQDREAAGIRSFTLAALTGALSLWLARSLASPALVAVGALVVGSLAVLAFRRSRSADPGLTTEIALFTTYLLGVMAMLDATLAAGTAAAMALLLAARTRLQRLATVWITEQELHDGLLLAALVLVLLPLLHSLPYAVLGTSPYALMRLVVVLLALQALGHLAQRLLGTRRGLWWAGLTSGLVSSTATVATLGARLRQAPVHIHAAVAGALASGVATWGLCLVLTFTASPRLGAALAPAAIAGAAVTLGASLWAWRMAGQAASAEGLPESGRMFQAVPALAVAAVLTLTTLLSHYARSQLGPAGLWITTALAALADAHAATAAVASLAAGGELPDATLRRAILLAVGVNTAVRSGVAAMAGGKAYAWRVAAGLWAGWIAAAALGL